MNITESFEEQAQQDKVTASHSNQELLIPKKININLNEILKGVD